MLIVHNKAVLIPLTSIVLFVQAIEVNGNQNCLATNIRKQYSAVERVTQVCNILLIILYHVDWIALPHQSFILSQCDPEDLQMFC